MCEELIFDICEIENDQLHEWDNIIYVKELSPTLNSN